MKISFLGAGHIAQILITRLIANGAVPSDITVSNPTASKCEILKQKFGVNAAASNCDAASASEVIFVCVPPQNARDAAEDIKNAVRGKTLISVCTGVPILFWSRACPGAAVCRILPNPPSVCGQGAVPIAFSADTPDARRTEITSLVSAFGKIFPVSEDKIDIFTSLTSPAPVLAFLDAMTDAGVLCGLDRRTSAAAAFQTIKGCLSMMRDDGSDIAEQTANACTPGGVSVEILRIMDRMAFRSAVKESYRAGWEKSKELGSVHSEV